MYFLILALFSVIVILIAAKSAMLRNSIFNDSNFCKLATTQGKKNPRPAFSLGRSQLAFWTVIIISSFVYAYLSANPQLYLAPVLATVNLTLLGIAAGTTVAGKIIDNSQNDNQTDTIPQQDYPSKNFLTDIISDEKGVSIHRLQNVIWTVIIGGIYIAYVANNRKLPDDSVITPQLLILMGISTGAYLGLKTTENTAPAVSAATTNTPAAPTVAAPTVAAPTVVAQTMATPIVAAPVDKTTPVNDPPVSNAPMGINGAGEPAHGTV